MKSLYALTMLLAASSLQAVSFGTVNFTTCVTDSKFGKQEQAQFEAMRDQMEKLIKDAEKQLTELAGKLQDTDYLDSLSPEAEQSLKVQLGTLQEEMQRYQNQAMQVMNQANMKLVQVMSDRVNTASKTVAMQKKLDFVINKDALFYYLPESEVTKDVIQELDKSFDSTQKTSTTPDKKDAK
jgi:outer membrane protein